VIVSASLAQGVALGYGIAGFQPAGAHPEGVLFYSQGQRPRNDGDAQAGNRTPKGCYSSARGNPLAGEGREKPAP
jgi:hypothetical protein